MEKINFKNKRVIVTGGAGVIGRVLVEKLVSQGAMVRCFDIAPKPKQFPEKVEYSQRDLALLNPLEFISFDPEYIFHLAATFERTEESSNFWEFNFVNNVVLSHKVIDAARYCKNIKKFIFASSYLIYDTKFYLSKTPKEMGSLSEESSRDPRNICGAAKYYTEKELEFMAFPAVSARIFRVYGRGSRDFISRSVRAALSKDSIELFLKENSFDYIFADDVAEGLLRLAVADAKGIFNLGTGRKRKIKEIIQLVKKYAPEVRVKELEAKSMYENSCADMAAFKKATGWVPQISLEEGIQHLFEYETIKKDKN